MLLKLWISISTLLLPCLAIHHESRSYARFERAIIEAAKDLNDFDNKISEICNDFVNAITEFRKFAEAVIVKNSNSWECIGRVCTFTGRVSSAAECYVILSMWRHILVSAVDPDHPESGLRIQTFEEMRRFELPTWDNNAMWNLLPAVHGAANVIAPREIFSSRSRFVYAIQELHLASLSYPATFDRNNHSHVWRFEFCTEMLRYIWENTNFRYMVERSNLEVARRFYSYPCSSSGNMRWPRGRYANEISPTDVGFFRDFGELLGHSSIIEGLSPPSMSYSFEGLVDWDRIAHHIQLFRDITDPTPVTPTRVEYLGSRLLYTQCAGVAPMIHYSIIGSSYSSSDVSVNMESENDENENYDDENNIENSIQAPPRDKRHSHHCSKYGSFNSILSKSENSSSSRIYFRYTGGGCHYIEVGCSPENDPLCYFSKHEPHRHRRANQHHYHETTEIDPLSDKLVKLIYRKRCFMTPLLNCSIHHALNHDFCTFDKISHDEKLPLAPFKEIEDIIASSKSRQNFAGKFILIALVLLSKDYF